MKQGGKCKFFFALHKKFLQVIRLIQTAVVEGIVSAGKINNP